MIKVAIVDDEIQVRKQLLSMLNKYAEENQISFSAVQFESGAAFLMHSEEVFDLILMDVQMPIIDGLETAKQLRKTNKTSTLVFITNSVQYAVEGYTVDATDYIVKPVSYLSFSMKIKHALEKVARQKHCEINLKTADGLVMLDIADIYYIEVMKHELIYHTAKGLFRVWGVLNRIENQLAEYHFQRCNICYLVNLQHVESLEDNDAIVKGTRLRISASKKKDFYLAMMHYMKGIR